MNTVKKSFPFPGAIGWAVTLGSVVVYDWWAIKKNVPTMSRTLGHYLAHPIIGPILAGASLGLSYHLLVEELLPEFLEQKPNVL
jgi:glycerol uptake facilitator-like aquaporin